MIRIRLATALALLVFFGVVSSANALAPAGGVWVWQNPLPFGWDLSDVTCSDGRHFWAATFTGGTVLRSADAGLTWQPFFTGVDGAMWGISSPDGLHAAVLYTQTHGFHGADVVAFTADGGETWTTRAFTPRTYGGVVDVDFLDPSHCWIATGSGLWLSADGGATWRKLRTPKAALSGVSFSDSDHGWIDSFSARAFSTSDGGRTWVERTPPGRNEMLGVFAMDAHSAWARVTRKSGGEAVLQTTDGGRTWRRRFLGTTKWIESLLPYSRDEAWIVTDDEALGEVMGGVTPSENPGFGLHHTTDGGVTWVTRSLGQDFPSPLAASGAGVVVAAGTSLWRSADRGVSWARLTAGGDHTLYDVEFVDATHGWAVGQRADTMAWADPQSTYGAILRTSDGTRWTDEDLAPGAELHAVSFVDPTHGWAVGERGRVVRTADGGATWTDPPSAGDLWLADVSFIDAEHGWALGETEAGRSRILRTVDGGDTWTATQLAPRQSAASVCFVSPTRGWVAGSTTLGIDKDGPLLLETRDGGATWARRSAGTKALYRVVFIDERRGWLLQEGSNNLGSVLRTMDGGATWRTTALPGPSDAYAEDISFADADHGWLAGDRIWKTSDGGVTWTIDGAQIAPWFVDWTLTAVAARPGGAVWAVGYGGRIISTVDTGADTAAPQTVDDGDRVWHRRGATIHLSATDVGGGAVARTEYRVDGESIWREGASVTFGAPADHYGDGAHMLRYRSVDDAGNVERTRICPVLVDTTAPWAGPGDDVRVSRGARVTLHYDLTDNLSPRLWTTVRIYSFLSSWTGGGPIRVLQGGLQAQGHRAVRFRCTLRRGWYRWSVSATDLAGNTFVPWAYGFLEVK